MRPGRRSSRRGRGFTLVWVLATLVVFSLGLAAIGPIWSEQVKRDREDELVRVGRLYAEAIASYRASSPGTLKQWPLVLDDLVLDTRFAGTKRHLRRLYADPVQPESAWGLIRAPGGGVMGVYSTSEEKPLRQRDVLAGTVTLPRAERYDQWKFIAPTPP